MKTFIDFVLEKHAGQIRKGTGMPYYTHLAEVAGFTALFVPGPTAACMAWGHDLVEDTAVRHDGSAELVYVASQNGADGEAVANGIALLSDIFDEGSTRAEKHNSAMRRLGKGDIIVHSVKCADVCSNAGSIHLLPYSPWVETYLDEKHDTLQTCDKASPELRRIGFAMVRRARVLVQQNLEKEVRGVL